MPPVRIAATSIRRLRISTPERSSDLEERWAGKRRERQRWQSSTIGCSSSDSSTGGSFPAVDRIPEKILEHGCFFGFSSFPRSRGVGLGCQATQSNVSLAALPCTSTKDVIHDRRCRRKQKKKNLNIWRGKFCVTNEKRKGHVEEAPASSDSDSSKRRRVDVNAGFRE